MKLIIMNLLKNVRTTYFLQKFINLKHELKPNEFRIVKKAFIQDTTPFNIFSNIRVKNIITELYSMDYELIDISRENQINNNSTVNVIFTKETSELKLYKPNGGKEKLIIGPKDMFIYDSYFINIENDNYLYLKFAKIQQDYEALEYNSIIPNRATTAAAI